MHFLRKLTRGILAYALRAAFLGFGIALALFLVFADSSATKHNLQQSGIYAVSIESFIDPSAESASGQEITAEQEALLKQSLSDVFPPADRQEMAEAVIDGTYRWLRGEAPAPDFEISFDSQRQQLINTLSADTFGRIASLPECTMQDLQSMQEIDPVTIDCKPPFDLTAEEEQFRKELESSEFLAETSLSGKDLFQEFERHDSTNSANKLPSIFQFAMALPWLLLGGIVVGTVGIIWLADSLRKGVKKLGKILLESALSLLVTGGFLYFVFGGLKEGFTADTSPELARALADFFTTLRWQLTQPVLAIIVAYGVIGLILIIKTHKDPLTTSQSDVEVDPSNLQTKHNTKEQ